jgi:hypothetical protein
MRLANRLGPVLGLLFVLIARRITLAVRSERRTALR